MNETLLILHSLIGALLEKGVDPRALGVDLTRVFPTLEEQGDAFFAGYVDGWNRMHEGMRTSPAMRGRLVIRNVSADDQVGEVLQAPGDQASGPEESEKKPESPLNPFQQALLEQQKQWDLEEQQEQATLTENARAYAKQQGQTAPVADPPKPKPVPITVEEVASSGFVVAEHPETIRNGSA
jgi:hypothetical protein